MSCDDLFLILSPNLGCPQLISMDDLKNKKPFTILIAEKWDSGISPLKSIFEGRFFLTPSYPEKCGNHSLGHGIPKRICLKVAKDPEEITDWDVLRVFKCPDDTRWLLSDELHYNVLGENTRYWKLHLVGDDAIGLESLFKTDLSQHEKGLKICLFDLVMEDPEKKFIRINRHSVQVINTFQREFHFIHVTDLHLARRNDEILDEVLKSKAKSKRPRHEIENSFINFNENFRKFIRLANEQAANGKLDFVVITGDIVDFVFHGWEEETDSEETNWKTFINILTGSEKEKMRNPANEGLKIAAFTSLGNHDWRLHPYDPNLWELRKPFGLKKEELKNYPYKGFDSSTLPMESKRAKLSQSLSSMTFEKLKIGDWLDKIKGVVINYLGLMLPKGIGVVITTLFGLTGGGTLLFGFEKNVNSFIKYIVDHVADLSDRFAKHFPNFEFADKFTDKILEYGHIAVVLVTILFVIGIIYLIKRLAFRWTHKLIDLMVDNPLHADSCGLEYYFKYINPYFDYAFQFGDHWFVVMDSGADAFTGQLLDEKSLNNLKKLSIKDNILGGSPDSRAFDSEHKYYNWSQIVWLEKMLAAAAMNKNLSRKVFMFLHAPPINTDEDNETMSSRFCESKRNDPKWIPKSEYNLTYGTINHYISQFFYLCLGYHEYGLNEIIAPPQLAKVDLVFSGHGHRNIEFRIDKDQADQIRIYSDIYSNLLPDDGAAAQWWESYRPIMVQTSSCGLQGKSDTEPPYFRIIQVDQGGVIRDFKSRNKYGKAIS